MGARPGMPAALLLALLPRIPPRSRLPAVALTAYGRPQDRGLSLTAGYNMHVPKPVDPGEFTAIIASVAQRGTAA